MGGCLACYNKPVLNTTSVNEVPKVLNTRKVRNAGKSKEFSTGSTFDMENGALQSQGSISSISTSNQTDPHAPTATVNTPSEFQNQGLLCWNEIRQRWLANKSSGKSSRHAREPKLNWNATYDSLLGSNKPFPQPIPLSEMVDFLVDTWEQEGLYD